MTLTVSLIAMAFLLGLLLILQRRPDRNSKRAEKKPKPLTSKSSEFHAVAINYTKTACDAAKAMAGKRFLSDAAPRLPLPECDVADCQCRFKHYSDRRNPVNRRSVFAAGIGGDTGVHQQEQRENRKDRRSDDDSL